MTTPYWQILRHLDAAVRLAHWAAADVHFGGDSDLDAAYHLRQAHEELDAARALVDKHRPADL